MKRPTINDIARASGVSKSAVSYALNGQPGVSPETRRRIVGHATALGWQPSSAARALRGLGASTVGLVIARKPHLLGTEPYFMQLVAGMAEDLGPAMVSLILEVVGEDAAREREVYSRWWSQGRVDGVFLVDLRVDDQRMSLVQRLKMPTLMLSHPQSSGLPAVWTDDAAAMSHVVDHLVLLGHRRIAHVAGIPDMAVTIQRTGAFTARAAQAGVQVAGPVYTDWGITEGDRATEQLLSLADRPTAIVYDNDIMAVSGVRLARRLGLRVPADLSVIAWDDSALCRLTDLPLTVVQTDVTGFGAFAAATLRRLIAGEPVGQTPFRPAVLAERASTGPAPAR